MAALGHMTPRISMLACAAAMTADLGADEGGDLDNFVLVTRELNRAPDRVCPTVCDSPPPPSTEASALTAGASGARCARAGARRGSAP